MMSFFLKAAKENKICDVTTVLKNNIHLSNHFLIKSFFKFHEWLGIFNLNHK